MGRNFKNTLELARYPYFAPSDDQRGIVVAVRTKIKRLVDRIEKLDVGSGAYAVDDTTPTQFYNDVFRSVNLAYQSVSLIDCGASCWSGDDEMPETLKIAKANGVVKVPRPMTNQDYRAYFCDVRYCVETAFDVMKATTNRAELLEILKTLARLVREKTKQLEEKEAAQ